MPPAKTDQLDLWADSGMDGDDQVMVDFLLPTGIYIQMEVPRESTIQHIKLLLWKEAQTYPLFSLLGEMEGHMFECVNQAAVHEELEDETRRLCDVRPFLPVLKLITRNCGRAERLLDSKIGVLIGKGLHELDALQDQEVKDFRSKMKRISEEKMHQMQMMSWGEWLRSCYSPQLETGLLENLIEKHEGVIKITMHYDQSQDTASLKVSLHCTVSELMDQALKKWQTTHGPEEDIGTRSDYVLRVSSKLEFLFEDYPLNQYKYIRACLLANENPHLTMVHCSVVKAMFEKEISTIGSVLARKTSNPPLPLPPKKRQPTQLHTCVWKVHSLFKINLVKGNKVNADDAAKVNIVNTSEFRMISLTLTFICLLVAQNQYYIKMRTCLFKGAVCLYVPFQNNDCFQTYKSRPLGTVSVKVVACNLLPQSVTRIQISARKVVPPLNLQILINIQITKNTHCFTEEFM